MSVNKIRPPSAETLKKYGLTEGDWYNILNRQGYKCPICGEPFTNDRRPVIDHEHIRGFKKKKNKRLYVRGVLHNFCNYRLLAKGMTAERAKNIYEYLKKYEKTRTRRAEDIIF